MPPNLLVIVPKQFVDEFHLLTSRDRLRCSRIGSHFHFANAEMHDDAIKLLETIKEEREECL